MNIKQKINAKVKAKTSNIKEKVKGKVAAKVGKSCAIAALLLAVAGCHMGEQPTAQRAQTSIIRDNIITVNVVSYPTNELASSRSVAPINVEVGNLAQANETSGTESMTASPSNTPTVSTPVRIDARYNDALAAASTTSKGVIESLTEAGANKVLSMMADKSTGTVDVEKKDGTTVTVECKDGQCAIKENCESCTDKTASEDTKK